MTSCRPGDREFRSCAHGGDVFIGSFNINSGDLSVDAASAWLKGAESADIVALGLQECATVPAKPFPEPTNGKAVALWKNVKDVVLPEARHTHGTNDSSDNPGVGASSIGGWGSSSMAGVAEAAMIAASTASRGLKKANLPPTCLHGDNGRGNGSTSSSCGSGQGPGEKCTSPGPARSSAEKVGGTQLGDDGEDCSPKMMRQESYYLRGQIEAVRDNNLLTTIADCIPGRCLVADVAMGETPTYGKIEVNVPRNASFKAVSKASSSSREGMSSSAAAVEAAIEASCSEGLDAADGHGPLDASGRPGWPFGDSGSGGVSADDGADDGSGAVLKKVEWYGTIRLLVFVRKGLYEDLKVRTVVIPAGDKPSVVADAPEDYAKDTSPDKGAVACYLEDASNKSPLQLLLVNCHLYGTNKYGVEEAVFDKYRMDQLRAIDSALAATLPTAAAAPLVLLGDLNFRVEMLSGKEDKAKGGSDFQKVRKIAEECDAKGLLDLYNRADRLRLVLERGEREGRDSPCTEEADHGGTGHAQVASFEVKRLPSLLKGLKDGLRAPLTNGQAIRPTFTFKPRDTSSTPRRFNDKRTPSWTDRVLWRGFRDDEPGHPQQHTNTTFASVPEVITSDHEPVYCLLGLPKSFNAPGRSWAS
ncbi:unnamed protein product [Pylaiella littoralis]